MSLRLAYPIPEPERSKLIDAGIAACWIPLNTPERDEASRQVRKVIANIYLKYGFEDGLEAE